MRVVRFVLYAATLLALFPAPSAAQSDPNPGALTITGATDVANAYMFRGIRQEDESLILWPYFDLGIALHSGDAGVKSVSVNLGTWNSLHKGLSGSDGPSRKLWYESDFYATLGLGFGGGFTLGTTYTAYTSPNNMFSTVKEVAFKASVDDHTFGRGLKPYALYAIELDATPGFGQADAGGEAGKYVEIGAAPGFGGGRAALTVPIKLGLSAGNYYEINQGTAANPVYQDEAFGYFSIAGVVTVPLGGTTRFGAWNVHGGVEFQKYGGTLEQINEGLGITDGRKVIYSGGIGFTY
jgi:hypothetical protein